MPAGAEVDVANGALIDQVLVALRQEGTTPVLAELCLHRLEISPHRGKHDDDVAVARDASPEEIAFVPWFTPYDF